MYKHQWEKNTYYYCHPVIPRLMPSLDAGPCEDPEHPNVVGRCIGTGGAVLRDASWLSVWSCTWASSCSLAGESSPSHMVPMRLRNQTDPRLVPAVPKRTLRWIFNRS